MIGSRFENFTSSYDQRPGGRLTPWWETEKGRCQGLAIKVTNFWDRQILPQPANLKWQSGSFSVCRLHVCVSSPCTTALVQLPILFSVLELFLLLPITLLFFPAVSFFNWQRRGVYPILPGFNKDSYHNHELIIAVVVCPRRIQNWGCQCSITDGRSDHGTVSLPEERLTIDSWPVDHRL